MWTHKSWQGRFLPHPLPADERLRSYATWCNAVEGNTTFYATPAKSTVASWARQTDPGFRFVIKLPKSITHEHRLTGADEALRVFLDAIEPLGPRAHALWLQLPGSFAPADVPALAGFLRRLPGSHRYAVEVRHRGFFDDPRTWLREGRSPTVFIHTPDNVDALKLARRFHDDVRTRLPVLEALPQPIAVEPPTLL
jgi:uncharacterized protein YecE (DUF72 family)